MGLCSRCSLGTRLSGAALTRHRPLRSTVLRQFLDNRYVTAGEELRLTVRCFGKRTLWTKDDEKQGKHIYI